MLDQKGIVNGAQGFLTAETTAMLEQLEMVNEARQREVKEGKQKTGSNATCCLAQLSFKMFCNAAMDGARKNSSLENWGRFEGL